MEKVILVDEKDKAVGEMEKIEAHHKALLHRAVSIFVFNTMGEMLIQKRALFKYHSPGLWTNTACTHPRMGEKNVDAAIRRANEEMGLELNFAEEIFDFIYKAKLDDEMAEYELDHVFILYSDEIPQINKDEVSDYMYINTKRLLIEIQNSPKQFTVWFKKIVERVIKHVEQHNMAM